MTEIEFDRLELSLTVRGHAGYAEEGKDIVCAGISAVFFSVPAALREKGFKYYADAEKGFATVQAYPAAEERHSCIMIFETALAGLKELAKHYPEYVTIKREG